MNEDILNPSLFIGNIEWREPMTTLTDMVMALVALWAFYQFHKKIPKGNASHPFFRNYFIFMGVGMTCAAWIGHGAQAYLSFDYKAIGWTITSIGFFNLQMGALRVLKSRINPVWFWIFNWTFVVQLVVYWILLSNSETRTFEIAQASTGLSVMGWVLPLSLYSVAKKINPKSMGIVLAISFAIAPAVVYNQQISIHKWMNYHDISHLLSAIYVYLLYRACKMIVEYKPVNSI